MVVETEVVPFSQWLMAAGPRWLIVVSALSALVVTFAWIVGALLWGPELGALAIYRRLREAVVDFTGISLRRVLALAWLAVKEAMRRRVLIALIVFLVLLLFAGWFLDPRGTNPGRLYLSFVLNSTSYLVLLVALFLSALSLPADIKNRTIHTIMTKPVRASEIILGRLVGFVALLTVLLAFLAALSYLFVERGLQHTHAISLKEMVPEAVGGSAGGRPAWKGYTSSAANHRHAVRILPNGQAIVESQQGHRHEVLDEGLDPSAAPRSVTTGGPEGFFVARVPRYGKLRFLNATGKPAEKGVNVGEEWSYRSYIEGATLAAAIWTFDGIRESDFPDGLPVELTISVFRTHKGDIEKGILGSLSVVNPQTGLKAPVRVFQAKKFATDSQFIPRVIRTAGGQQRDLFRDFVADGVVEIHLECSEPEQYYGAAQADLYLRARDVPFAWNFVKGYVGIWLQAVLLLSFGLMFSTFLSAPIAMLATLGALMGGMFSQWMVDLAAGKIIGGGPLEAAIRLVNQDNLTTPLEPGLRTAVAQALDRVLSGLLGMVGSVLPRFNDFSYTTYLADGFNVPGDLALSQGVTVLAFVVPVFVAAYFLLKTREVAQ